MSARKPSLHKLVAQMPDGPEKAALLKRADELREVGKVVGNLRKAIAEREERESGE